MFRYEQQVDLTGFNRISKQAYEYGRIEEIRKLAHQPFEVSYKLHRDAYLHLQKFLNKLTQPLGNTLGDVHEKVVFYKVRNGCELFLQRAHLSHSKGATTRTFATTPSMTRSACC
jgi:hypothetical protein